ncbi:MAG: single-stranded DNA-binding protein [Kingella oralis]
MNNITVAGRFTKNAETRVTPNGKYITTFSLAENTYQNGEQTTQFYDCQLWGERGQKLAQHIQKGGNATVTGSLQIRKYTDRQGTERTAIEINVNDIALQGSAQQTHRQPAQQTQPQDHIPF